MHNLPALALGAATALVCCVAAVALVNVVVVWIGIQMIMDRRPMRQEITWLWSSWRHPLVVAMWACTAWTALYLDHAGMAALRENPWFIGLLALVVANSANAISHYHRARLSVDRPAIFVSVEPDDGDDYALIVTSTLAHPAHDVRAEVVEGDAGILSSAALSVLLSRGIGSIRPGETRYPLTFVGPGLENVSPAAMAA